MWKHKEAFVYLQEELGKLASEIGERLMKTPNNNLSIGNERTTHTHTLSLLPFSLLSDVHNTCTCTGMSLAKFAKGKEARFVGSMLFSRAVSGTRVIGLDEKKEVSGITFPAYGAHHDTYLFPYLTASASIGMTKEEIDIFIRRLRKVFQQHKKNVEKESPKE
jgi:O-phospho-L-seryl-tRNASec:L-selenocysteinyl-tRNA synthase